MKDKRFELSVTRDGDSVVCVGSIKDGSFITVYFGEYEDALKYISAKCEEYILEMKFSKEDYS